MNILLFLPAAGVILLQAMGPKSFRAGLYMLQVQIILAYPFSSKFFISYVTRAFEFNRVFIYKWTVNWRFVDESIFLSHEFSQTLLFLQANILLFYCFTRWLKPSDMSVFRIIQTVIFPMPRSPGLQKAILGKMTPEYILKTLYTCNLIGILCARSLHYQFYSWFSWTLPYLLSTTNLHPLIQFVIWVAQEYSWNVFPSTKMSSAIVVSANALILVGVWFGTKGDFEPQSNANSDMASISVTESSPVIPSSSRSLSNSSPGGILPTVSNSATSSKRDKKKRK
ncbi:ALG3 protein-domain-containing protein [Dipodascopsis uninucleata]